jgi:hypothetical protein
MSDKRYEVADRVSDGIVNVLNAELAEHGPEPVQMLAGQLLALIGYLRTAPEKHMPDEVIALRIAAQDCLMEIERHMK